jgi:hypothetical protein
VQRVVARVHVGMDLGQVGDRVEGDRLPATRRHRDVDDRGQALAARAPGPDVGAEAVADRVDAGRAGPHGRVVAQREQHLAPGVGAAGHRQDVDLQDPAGDPAAVVVARAAAGVDGVADHADVAPAGRADAQGGLAGRRVRRAHRVADDAAAAAPGQEAAVLQPPQLPGAALLHLAGDEGVRAAEQQPPPAPVVLGEPGDVVAVPGRLGELGVHAALALGRRGVQVHGDDARLEPVEAGGARREGNGRAGGDARPRRRRPARRARGERRQGDHALQHVAPAELPVAPGRGGVRTRVVVAHDAHPPPSPCRGAARR